ncbi:Sequestosome-1, partial [Stegodyphus mimosarum]
MVHVIKVYYDSGNGIPEIRRLAVCSDVLTKFVFLEQKIVELYPILKDKSFRIAWKDSDDDLIQMSSDPELAQALANAEDGLIKLYITLQPREMPSISVAEAAEVNDAAKTNDANAAKTNQEVHPFVICDGCNNSVKGYRYKCLECKDFDLCSSCHADNKHPEHDMLKLTRPHSVSREWVFPGARHMWRGMF